ncbi:MAG: ABC transporter permease subunit [Aureispira sp.]|nr:ABC transporter permease subunit [Aureispira sp.]
MASPLFKLRGKLDSKQSLLLTSLGVLFLIGIWAIVAQFMAEENVRRIRGEEIEITDRKYYDNDSLRGVDLDKLMAMNNEELLPYGLRKEMSFKLLPSPIAVFSSFQELYEEDELVVNTGKSVYLNALGYLLAIGFALPIGFLLGLIPLFRGLFNRVFDAFRFIPLTAVTGIFIMWLGLDSGMKVSFLAFGIIVYLVPVVIQRIDEVEDVYLKTTFTLGATNWQTVKTVYIPSVLSRIFDDIRVLTAISWTYITIAELLNKSGGIGELIWIANRQSRIDKAFAILIIIVIIGVIQDKLFLLLDKVFFPYKHVNNHK